MAAKKKILTKEDIVSMYMNDVLEKGEKLKSVFQFVKGKDFSEAEFYAFFGTLEGLEKEIFKLFLVNTIDLLHKNTDYQDYDMKNKMLSFYFTFFEILTANRSFVLLALKNDSNPIKNLKQLSALRESFKEYVAEILTDDYRIEQERLQKFQEKSLQESAWIQLMLTIKFWMDDVSPAFEKTDIFIEKSVNASFELMNIAPINHLIDLGKFLFKEKIYSK
ncbi:MULTISPECIES: TetR family transcriptional regulator C-terminal domain-containing protein [Flavobacterium]|uniref:TetR/AcrR family transcriptional regulator n=2 Tax=Flavobacterium TaxID=237 RepID=A0A941AZC9_9FLAO|nr:MULTISPECIES: TetR family transcriptional regulator C-terminal domain-containing protein [Flavobacterium]MBP4138822.1 TetR/AcrR family transcriptional regulator [Flavobacterium geliluteum]MDX6182511.1 TetR family transcriptional regulator C-terminal domain-containing protein [Flavobacterium sp. Fl-33]MDX6185576.1 TetR family transcriptional regulator C-terminal domain-containing protein [Flavobacterium sp. Fl-77]UFH38764.1 TetR/AcrR family transcriptional regulator [Flavobacterium sp. F-70]